MKRHMLAFACLTLFLMACEGEVRQSNMASNEAPTVAIPNELLEPVMTQEGLREHVRAEESTSGSLAPLPTEKVRLRRRLDLDQLDASIRRVSGGIGWTEQRGSAEVNLFEDLAETLGKPDFRESTREDLAPSIIFQKFLGDAARSVCEKTVERDATSRPGSERSIYLEIAPNQAPAEHPEATRANLRALLLRFHGRMITDDDDPRLAHWQWLLDSTMHTSQDARSAWRTVCVGLMTHPDFYMY